MLFFNKSKTKSSSDKYLLLPAEAILYIFRYAFNIENMNTPAPVQGSQISSPHPKAYEPLN